jgi:hypothetical protein
MLQTDELAQVAEDLRREGVDARHSFVFCSHMWVEGLEIDDEFFPLWELMAEDNGEAFERRDFAAIVARRRADWSVELVRAGHA